MIRLWLDKLRTNEDGAATVEYILLLFLIGIVCIAAENQVHESLSSLYTRISDTIAAGLHGP
jgi:Flp pilus assembly pilin Flp